MAELPPFIQQQFVDIGNGHQLHVAEYGCLKGPALLYLHGGPGAGCSRNEVNLFVGTPFHLYFVDQRGAGRSRPSGCLLNNTVMDLVADIETLRCVFGVEKWYLAGGSFGATLAWLYSGLYPSRVRAQVLWGMFIPSKIGINWLYGPNGVSQFFNAQYARFIDVNEPVIYAGSKTVLSQADTHQGSTATIAIDHLMCAYQHALNHHDPQVVENAVHQWLMWECALAQPSQFMGEVAQALSCVQIGHHYVQQHFFDVYSQFKALGGDIKASTVLIQGEHDWVCPEHILTAFTENCGHQSLEYQHVSAGYHALADQRVFQAVTQAIQRLYNTTSELS
ncbi:alpha/beta fold hydrolase [Shewanella livingstonensis]|uniref:Proline iminopeptidase n=1 Tax=Shewanella livingstonensis TaxID=150120 RepID=A0A3G8M1H2_9GAMM|nr:alpha/beta fold hydrolase [Shewanella livingstonensis]AZG74982.1 alpha/beta fold hydrolase [Shewanella livingstonensis]